MNTKEEQLLIAIEKSIANSEELISDAELLEENKRLPRAYALYQLAMEEAGKAMDICGHIILGLLKNETGLKGLKRNFKDHIEKAQKSRVLSLFFIIELKKRDKDVGEKLLEWTLQEIQEPHLLNEYKNYSLYTSFIDDEYKLPREIITQERVNYISIMAKSRTQMTKAYLTFSLPHLKVLKEYVENNPLPNEKLEESIKEFIEGIFT